MKYLYNFYRGLPVVKEYLETDVEAAYSGDPAAFSKSEIIISYPGLYAVMVYRLSQSAKPDFSEIVSRLFTEKDEVPWVSVRFIR